MFEEIEMVLLISHIVSKFEQKVPYFSVTCVHKKYHSVIPTSNSPSLDSRPNFASTLDLVDILLAKNWPGVEATPPLYMPIWFVCTKS